MHESGRHLNSVGTCEAIAGGGNALKCAIGPWRCEGADRMNYLRFMLGAGCCFVVCMAMSMSAYATELTSKSVYQGEPDVVLRPGEPLPDLLPGSVVVLEAGEYQGPWEVTTADVTIYGHGATLLGSDQGSTLVLNAPGIHVVGLTVNGAGPINDLYSPDAAFWLIDCHVCVLDGVSSVNAPTAVRAEESRAAMITEGRFEGESASPAVTVYSSPGFALVNSTATGFLDSIYLERTDFATVSGNKLAGAFRYALHIMFSRDALVENNTVTGGNVGSAAMYSRDIVVRNNVFEGHVGPLAFGLLIQELENALIAANRFVGNTIGLLVVSTPHVLIENNVFSEGGFGMLVQRARTGPTSAVSVLGNRFHGNVSDVAVDDPDAAMFVLGNQFEGASPLDADADGVSDVPHLPSSTYDMLASRQPDLSLFALSPGILLWQSAEVTVPALRLATLQDRAAVLTNSGPWEAAPAVLQPPGNGLPGVYVAVPLIMAALLVGTAYGKTRARLS